MLASDVDSYRVIDTDTHVIEPYDLWTSRLPSPWGDRVPHVKWDDNFQEDAWYFGSHRIGAAASAAQAGWTEYPPQHPKRLSDVDPATWDASKRLARMDEYGIYAAVLYPNVAGFGAGKLLAMEDPQLMLACVQAYNDFLTDYASADPRRYVPIMALPMWDMDLTVKEIRAAAAGHRGVIMTGEPTFWGLPPLADRYWDPLWAAAPGYGALGQLPHRLGRHVDLRHGRPRAPGRTPTTPASACSSAWPTPGSSPTSSPAGSATGSPAPSSSRWRAGSAGSPSPWSTSTGSG